MEHTLINEIGFVKIDRLLHKKLLSPLDVIIEPDGHKFIARTPRTTARGCAYTTTKSLAGAILKIVPAKEKCRKDAKTQNPTKRTQAKACGYINPYNTVRLSHSRTQR